MSSPKKGGQNKINSGEKTKVDKTKYEDPLSYYDSDYEEEDEAQVNNGKRKISNLKSVPVPSLNGNGEEEEDDYGMEFENNRRYNSGGGDKTVSANDFTIYNCAHCNLTFSNMDEMNEHINSRNHRPESMTLCPVCSKSIPSRLLQSHLKIHAGARKPHPCPQIECPLAFYRFEDWRVHIHTHNFQGQNVLPVPANPKPPNRVHNSSRRVEKISKDDPRLLKSKMNLGPVRNRRVNNVISPSFPTPAMVVHCCPICRQTYGAKSHLELHLLQAHNSTISNSIRGAGGGLIISTQSNSYVQQPQVQIASQQSPYLYVQNPETPTCPHCYAVFVSEEFLQTHILKNCTMKEQSLANGYGTYIQKPQQPPPPQPRKVIFVPRKKAQAKTGNVTLPSMSMSIQQQQQQKQLQVEPSEHEMKFVPEISLQPQQLQQKEERNDSPVRVRRIGILRKMIAR